MEENNSAKSIENHSTTESWELLKTEHNDLKRGTRQLGKKANTVLSKKTRTY